jgi:ribosome hibernation promoting factor
MQLEMRVRNTDVVHALRAYVERRLRFALDRFDKRIRRVTVRIGDLNGPRGGEDKLCRIQVDVVPPGTLLVEERNADIYGAIDRAARRLKESMGRELQRRRATKR